MFEKEELENWIAEISKFIAKPRTIYLIGGGAMSFKGYKAATKDIDIVLLSKANFEIVNNAILSAGFKLETDIENEFYLTALAVYLKGKDSRIDVFLKEVGKMLVFTPKMAKRSTVYKRLGHLTVMLASNEDIFLLKSMTPRPEDIEDCKFLIGVGLDWDVVFDEIVEQSKAENKWFFWTFEKICAIEDESDLSIPVKAKLFELVKKYWQRKPSDFMYSVKNLENHIPKKYQSEILKNLKKLNKRQ